MRIWYQSFTDPTRDSGYQQRLLSYLNEIAEPGTEITLDGLTPGASEHGRLNELRCGLHAINRAIEAQENGYDAVILGHFQEPGLYEARSSIDIPIVGIGEASMHYALSFGRMFGLVTIHPIFVPIHQEQADRYGVSSRLAGITSLDASREDIRASFTDPAAAEHVLSAFEAAAGSLVEAEADVIVPAGGLPGMLLASRPDYRVATAPVLNPIAIALTRAEAEVKLHRLTGLTPSQSRTFKRASPAAIEYFRQATQAMLGK